MRVVIIGGGFAGLYALRELRALKNAELVLIDRKKTFDFLPCVPDIIGRGVRPSSITVDLGVACGRFNCSFLNQKVERIDLEHRQLYSSIGTIPYDYALVTSGATTNFYGNEAARKYGYTLYTVEDGVRLLSALESSGGDCVISGGGYTGVEAASCVRRYFAARGSRRRVLLVELSQSILGTLPQWMRDYAAGNLARMGIEVRTKTTIADVGEKRVSLSDGTTLEGAVLVWSAGMRSAELSDTLEVKKNPQGRIAVDDFLRFSENCFAAGDAAFFTHGGKPLRMSIQFAITQGIAAARNIIRASRGRQLTAYRPQDLGYIIPMANNRSCGVLFSVFNVQGRLPTVLHYLMCLYRSYGWRNRSSLARDILGWGVR